MTTQAFYDQRFDEINKENKKLKEVYLNITLEQEEYFNSIIEKGYKRFLESLKNKPKCNEILDFFIKKKSPKYKDWIIFRTSYHQKKLYTEFSLSKWRTIIENLESARLTINANRFKEIEKEIQYFSSFDNSRFLCKFFGLDYHNFSRSKNGDPLLIEDLKIKKNGVFSYEYYDQGIPEGMDNVVKCTIGKVLEYIHENGRYHTQQLNQVREELNKQYKRDIDKINESHQQQMNNYQIKISNLKNLVKNQSKLLQEHQVLIMQNSGTIFGLQKVLNHIRENGSLPESSKNRLRDFVTS